MLLTSRARAQVRDSHREVTNQAGEVGGGGKPKSRVAAFTASQRWETATELETTVHRLRDPLEFEQPDCSVRQAQDSPTGNTGALSGFDQECYWLESTDTPGYCALACSGRGLPRMFRKTERRIHQNSGRRLPALKYLRGQTI
jgi:hypothetical protein